MSTTNASSAEEGRPGPAGRGIRFLRGLVITVVSGVIAGGVVGAGARLAMRVVALSDRTPGTAFTAGGTLGILFTVTLFGMPFVGFFVAVREALPGGSLRKGVLFGAGMAVFPGLPFVLGEALEVGRPWMNLPMFGGLFLAY
ncbi:MAG: hypothetical protein HYU54_02530, partial [Actinobacteria bacterium]|nr:hypothetical protein [Actinomycetota bacterium]